jgi:uncharacterized repeat protein (TIGR01451 family)
MGFNLIENPNGFDLLDSGSSDVVDEDAKLEGLADNGGDTLTHALQSDSPAIDAGSCKDTVGEPIACDQRGRIRPQGLACDVGAYESAGPHLSLTKHVDDDLPKPGDRITYTIAVENKGDADATGGTISDTLPPGLSSAQPITLEPPTAGAIANPPALVTNLSVQAGERVTVTLPVTVHASLHVPTTITNTATVTSEQVPMLTKGSRAVVVMPDLLYLPMVVRAVP